MLLDVTKLKAKCVKKAKYILTTTPNMNLEEVSKFSEGACILLTWMLNIIKWYLGSKYLISNSTTEILDEPIEGMDGNRSKYAQLKH